TSACPTGKNISDGLRHTWTIQFAAAHSSATTAKTAAIRAQPGIDWNRRYARLTRLALERTRAGRARVRFMILGYPIRVESLQRGFHARERRQHGQARRGPEAGDLRRRSAAARDRRGHGRGRSREAPGGAGR